MSRHGIELCQVYIPKRRSYVFVLIIREVVHFEVLKSGLTVNADLYCEQLHRVNQELIENGASDCQQRRHYYATQ